MVRATLAPMATPSGKSSKLAGGRKMDLMLGGRPPRTAFMVFSRGLDAGMMYVTRKLWWRTSCLASSTSGMMGDSSPGLGQWIYGVFVPWQLNCVGEKRKGSYGQSKMEYMWIRGI